ncbi:DUF4232 domain-containing protein [Dactylosporangium sp. CA-052675]|uniref:DUF4232 domain-containing protein n=1 Tax=Dactylosporangium sp. CA-052675 TaxID=3239927 RepID=UPI003D8F69AA
MRTTGVALLALLLLAGCARPGPQPQNTLPTTASARPSVTPSAESTACPGDGLRLSAERGDAAMGYREMGLRLENCGDRPVTVSGRPEVVVLGEDRDPQDIAIVPARSHSEPAHPVALAPGQSTLAVLAWRNTYDDISKPPVSGVYLAVTPTPGAARQIVRPTVPLDLGSTGKLEVSVWL